MLNKIKNRFNNKKGFTLVELIVVIVIILILAAVLVPNVTKYVGNAKKSSVQSDASAIFTQLQAEYTAYVAAESNVTSIIDATDPSALKATINGVVVTQTTSAPTDKAASFECSNGQITKFVYKDGTYTCTWSGGSWTISES